MAVASEEIAHSSSIKVEKLQKEHGRTDWKVSGLIIEGKGKARIPVRLQKVPIAPILDTTKVDGGVLVGQSKTLDYLKANARLLRELPTAEKIDQIVALTRSSFTYYGQAAKQALVARPAEIEWLDNNVTAGSFYKASLVEALDHGYGICGHFNALGSLMAQEAGLEVVVNHADGEMTPVNIIRSDTNEPLFKNAPLGERVGAHVWFEVLDNGLAIPVDPTTNLTGTTEAGREIFREAKFTDAHLAFSQLEQDVKPGGIVLNLHANIPTGELSWSGGLDFINRTDTEFRGQVEFSMQLLKKYAVEQRGGLIFI